MSKLLVLNVNPSGSSINVTVANKFLDTYKKNNPKDTVTWLDLFDIYVPELNTDTLATWEALGKGKSVSELTENQQKQYNGSNQLLDQFLDHDKYILITPLWNGIVPARLHNYLDLLCVPRKTFQYGESGPQGLITGKKALHIHASGAVVKDNEISIADEFVKGVFSLIGVKDYELLLIHGHQQNRDKAEEIEKEAIERAKQLADKF